MTTGYSAPQFGLLADGTFVPKLASDVLLDMQNYARANVDPTLDLNPDTGGPLALVSAIIANMAAEIWANAAAIVAAIDPNQATALQLDNICAITGTKRTPATYGKVVVNLSLNANASIPVGTVLNVSGEPLNTWQLVGAGSSTTSYTPGPVSTVSAGTVSAVFQCTQTGPISAPAGTLTVIAAGSVQGLVSATNPADAVLGTNQETDSDLQARRNEELGVSGACTASALEAALLQVPSVTSAVVYSNRTNAPDAFGRPAFSFEAVIWDSSPPQASNSAIAQVIWSNLPAMSSAYSATGDSGTATDSQGNTHTIGFSRVTPVPIFLSYTITTGPQWDPVNGPTLVKQAITAYVNQNIAPGTTVNALELAALLFPAYGGIAGVVDVALTLGTSASPTGTSDIPMGVRQIATIPTSNISIATV